MLNVISHATAYCLYPRATLENQSTLMLRADEILDEAVYRDYVHRGYQFILASRSGDHTYRYGTPRNLKDPYTWRISLDLSGLAPSSDADTHYRTGLSRDAIFMSSWTLQRDPCIRIVFDVLSYPSFYHAYVADDRVIATALQFLNAAYSRLSAETRRL